MEGVAGTVGSVKACLEGGDVGERAARARRRALTKAVGRGLNRGCIPVAGSFPELSAQDQSFRGRARSFSSCKRDKRWPKNKYVFTSCIP